MNLALIYQLVQADKGSGGISDGINKVLAQCGGLIHGCHSAGSPLGSGSVDHIRVRDKTADLTAIARQGSLIDAGGSHLGIRDDACAGADGIQRLGYHILGKAQVLGIIKIRACVNAALYNRLSAGNQGSIAQLLSDDFKAPPLNIPGGNVF